MAKLIWSPRAAADLEETCQYISKDSEHYAKIFACRVVALVETIAQVPMMGRIVPEYDRVTCGKGYSRIIASCTV